MQKLGYHIFAQKQNKTADFLTPQKSAVSNLFRLLHLLNAILR
jgi:hypothetical protein